MKLVNVLSWCIYVSNSLLIYRLLLIISLILSLIFLLSCALFVGYIMLKSMCRIPRRTKMFFKHHLIFRRFCSVALCQHFFFFLRSEFKFSRAGLKQLMFFRTLALFNVFDVRHLAHGFTVALLNWFSMVFQFHYFTLWLFSVLVKESWFVIYFRPLDHKQQLDILALCIPLDFITFFLVMS